MVRIIIVRLETYLYVCLFPLPPLGYFQAWEHLKVLWVVQQVTLANSRCHLARRPQRVPSGTLQTCNFASPAVMRVVSVSWASFGAEFGSRTWCLLQSGPCLLQSKTEPELHLLWLCQGQKVPSQALSEHGQAEGKCEPTLLPTRQPQISKKHESQGGLIYSWCFNLSLSLLPRSHSRRGTEAFLHLSPSQLQIRLQPFIDRDHGCRMKGGFTF